MSHIKKPNNFTIIIPQKEQNIIIKNKKHKFKPVFLGFTLVELIVVIVILAILATIAFLSFNNYSISARDSRRMSNVNIISKGLDVNIVLGRNINTSEAGTGMNILIVGSGGISYSGYYMNLGNKLLSSIQVSGGDILNDTFQKYQLTYIPDDKYYQVMGLLEKQAGTAYEENYIEDSYLYNNIRLSNNILNINNLLLIDKVQAATTSSGYAFIKGNFPINTASGGYIKGLIPRDYTNAPVVNGLYTISGTGDIVIPADIISSNGGYNNGGITINASCTLSGINVNHGDSIDGYSEYSIIWNAGYDCTNRKLTRTCSNGTLSGDSSYQYSSCVKGTPNNCASGNYSSAGTQIYNLPSTLNHSLSYTGITITGITNGTKTYTATLTCNDGNIHVNNESFIMNCAIGSSYNGASGKCEGYPNDTNLLANVSYSYPCARGTSTATINGHTAYQVAGAGNNNGTNPVYINYTYTQPVKLTHLFIAGDTNDRDRGLSWSVDTSDDGTNWTRIWSNTTYMNTVDGNFYLGDNGYHKYWRSGFLKSNWNALTSCGYGQFGFSTYFYIN